MLNRKSGLYPMFVRARLARGDWGLDGLSWWGSLGWVSSRSNSSGRTFASALAKVLCVERMKVGIYICVVFWGYRWWGVVKEYLKWYVIKFCVGRCGRYLGVERIELPPHGFSLIHRGCFYRGDISVPVPCISFWCVSLLYYPVAWGLVLLESRICYDQLLLGRSFGNFHF